MGNWIQRVTRWFTRAKETDILPPDTPVGRGLAPDIANAGAVGAKRPGGNRRSRHPRQYPREEFIEQEDRTEELLVLTEDHIRKLDAEGFDPYNTDKPRRP